MKETSKPLPYNVSMKRFDSLLNELKGVGNEGISLETLWVNMGMVKNLNRSYILNFAKYLGLVESNNNRAWLTNLGRKASIAYGEKRSLP